MEHAAGPWIFIESPLKAIELKRRHWLVGQGQGGGVNLGVAIVFGDDVANASLISAAPELLELAVQYASECGECAGVGITPDDQDCQECKFIRDVIAKAGG